MADTDVSKAPPAQLVQALRELIAQDSDPDPKENVARNVNLTFSWDGGGSAIAAGEESTALVLDFPVRVNGWTAAGKRSETGSASFTVLAGLYADYPVPVSIVASAPPTITTAVKNEGDVASVSTWDKVLPRRTTMVAVADTISGFTKMTLSLSAKRLDL